MIDVINYASKQFDFSVITFFDHKPLAEQLNDSIVIHCVYKRKYETLMLIKKIKDILQLTKPDIVHTHLFGGDMWGAMAARISGVPIVRTEHNFNYSEGTFKGLIKKYIAPTPDRYVAVSPAVAGYVKEYYGFSGVVEVIRPGIEVGRFRTAPLSSSGLQRAILIVGRLVEQKGHMVALQALAKLRQYDWCLTIVGDGQLLSNLQKAVVRLKLGDRVIFKSAFPQIEKEYQAHEIVLVPSLWEGLGLVVMESMAAGRVTVASNVGGIAGLITDQLNGLLFISNNSDDLAKKLEDCFKKWPEMMVVGKNAAKYAEENFEAENSVALYNKIYLELAKK